MIRAAKIICWLCVLLVLVGIGTSYRYNPNIVRGHNFVPLMPFAIALAAFYSEPNRRLIWVAIAVNVLFAFLGFVLFGAGLLDQMGTPWVGLLMGSVFVVLAALNVVALKARLSKVATA
jgi:small neutral amino acid transporter SnatA (MarC family)